jgi:hypothetical protein
LNPVHVQQLLTHYRAEYEHLKRKMRAPTYDSNLTDMLIQLISLCKKLNPSISKSTQFAQLKQTIGLTSSINTINKENESPSKLINELEMEI